MSGSQLHRLARDRDCRDIAGAAILIAIGLFMAFHAASRYGLGGLSRMQPGMFPTILGALMVGLGLLTLVPAAIRLARRETLSGNEGEGVEWKSLAVIVAALAAFALVVPSFGMVPAIVALTAVAALGEGRLGIVGALVLGLVLSAMVVVTFSYGLGVTVPIARWPF